MDSIHKLYKTELQYYKTSIALAHNHKSHIIINILNLKK